MQPGAKKRKGAGVGPTQWAKKCVTCKCRQRLENLLEFDAINVTITDIRHIKKGASGGRGAPFYGFSATSSSVAFATRSGFGYGYEYEYGFPSPSPSPSPCIIQQNVCHTNYQHTIECKYRYR